MIDRRRIVMRRPDPVQVVDLFPQERAALLDLLSGLTPEEWERPTVCTGWSVKDVALHILGGDLANLSRRRDDYRGLPSAPGEDVIAFVNRINDEWVQAARRLSPRVLLDLLALVGPQLFDYFASLDLAMPGSSVSWAGLNPAPMWLDVAREYTERWLHQQHIRDAVGRPGLTDRRFMAPVLATFVYALPHAFRDTDAPAGAAVQLHIAGEAGGDWFIVREAHGWQLYAGRAEKPAAHVDLDQSIAWQLFTKGMTPSHGEEFGSFTGDKALGLQVLRAVAIIA
jgi:uncharacterized protein (TIGR03083 family)